MSERACEDELPFRSLQQRRDGVRANRAHAQGPRAAPAANNPWVLGALAIHRVFSAGLSAALTTTLGGRVVIEVTDGSMVAPAALEELLSESVHSIHLRIAGTDAQIRLALSGGLVFPALDQLLGGTGQAVPPDRRLSHVELRLLKVVAKHCSEQLASAWSVDGAVRLDFSEPPTTPFASVNDPHVLVQLRTSVAGQEGSMRIGFPVGPFASLLKLALPRDLPVEMRAVLGSISISSTELRRLKCGDILNTRLPADGHVSLDLLGHHEWLGAACSFRGRKAVRVTRRAVPDTCLEARAGSPPKQGV